MKKKNYKHLGIALGGGAVLGSAHVGVLKAMHELDIVPEYISGASIGAFVAAHIAFGVPIGKIEEIALDLNWLDITSFKISKLGILSNDKLGKLILDLIGKVNIEDSKIPLCMISTDISTGKKLSSIKVPSIKL